VKVTEVGLYDKLAAASGLTDLLSAATAIYPDTAPQGTAKPYVVYSYAGGGLENINPSELHNTVFIVKGIADSVSVASNVAAQIKTALHLQALTVSGYTNFITLCENEVQLMETSREGALIWHRGWYVRIRLDD
jgi:hypothetical protein